jgi:hypothetical protein
MKPLSLQRKALAVALAVLVAVVIVGTMGTVPHWGELAAPTLGVSMLGLWVVGTVAWKPGRR